MRKEELKAGRNYRLISAKKVIVYDNCPTVSKDSKRPSNANYGNSSTASIDKGSVIRFEGWISHGSYNETSNPIFMIIHGTKPKPRYDVRGMNFSRSKSGIQLHDCSRIVLHGTTGDASDADIEREIRVTRAEDTRERLNKEVKDFTSQLQSVQKKLAKVDKYLVQLKKYSNTKEAMTSLTTQLRASDITVEEFQQEVQLIMNPPELVL